MSPVFRSRRKERVSAIEAYGFGRAHSTGKRHDIRHRRSSAQLVEMGDRVMAGRESTTRTMVLIDRADLPWRAGEWFVLRIIAVARWPWQQPSSSCGHTCSSALVIGLVVGALPPTVDPALPGAAPRAEVRGRPARRPDARRHLVELGLQPAPGTRRRGEGRPGAGRQGVLPGPGRGADRCRRQRCTRPHGRADGQREHAVGDHGHPHPARGRRQPRRDPAHDRGDPAGA